MTYMGNHTAQKRNYSSYTENEENLADAEFGYYLAGLIEGDGSIAVREGVREKIAPSFVFTFHKRELPLFEKLKQEFVQEVLIKIKIVFVESIKIKMVVDL